MLNRHSSQNLKRAVEPHPTRNGEAVRTAFADTQLASNEHAHETRHAWSLDSNVIRPSRAVAPDAVGFRWLASLKEAILSFHAHWQREREIRKAIAALTEFDDRTLRDMGIPSRSEIEHAVRCCRDC
jgi:uncharacterized protein YjiS (DUF1127 family)